LKATIIDINGDVKYKKIDKQQVEKMKEILKITDKVKKIVIK
jgi:hypothetical protein